MPDASDVIRTGNRLALPGILYQGCYNRSAAMAGPDRQTSGEVLERTRQETKKPELYKVLLLNDDYTPMEFVVHVLEPAREMVP